MGKALKIISISDLRQNAGCVEGRFIVQGICLRYPARASGGSRVGMHVYEDSRRELDILRLLARSEKEIEAGVGYELEDVVEEAEGGVDHGHGDQGQV